MTLGLTLGGNDGPYVGLTTLPPSCAGCLEIWKISNSWNLQGLSRPVMRLLYLYYSGVKFISLGRELQYAPTQVFLYFNLRILNRSQ